MDIIDPLRILLHGGPAVERFEKSRKSKSPHPAPNGASKERTSLRVGKVIGKFKMAKHFLTAIEKAEHAL
jgi:hypothetical protein